MIFDLNLSSIILISVLIFFITILIYVRLTRNINTYYYYNEHTKESKYNSIIVENIKKECGNYNPPWFYNVILQALINFGRDLGLIYDREIYEYEDETTFAVDWYPFSPNSEIQTNKQKQCSIMLEEDFLKVVIFLPGLGSSSNERNSQNLAYTLANQGYICGIITPRGLDIPLKTKRVWHAGSTEDLEFVISRLNETFIKMNLNEINPTKLKIFLIGNSASSNIVKKMLLSISLKARKDDSVEVGILSENVKIMGGMVNCICYDYTENIKKLESTLLGRLTSIALGGMYKKFIKLNPQIHHLIGEKLVKNLLSSRYMSDFDFHASTGLYGYSSCQAYMDDMSNECIKDMKLPYLAIEPSDDPVYGNEVLTHIPVQNYCRSPFVIFMMPSHGNHLGFFEGSLFTCFSNTTSYTYPAKVAISFFNSIQLKNQDDNIKIQLK